jgi:hypothetical protein
MNPDLDVDYTVGDLVMTRGGRVLYVVLNLTTRNVRLGSLDSGATLWYAQHLVTLWARA